jgi:cytochrome c556
MSRALPRPVSRIVLAALITLSGSLAYEAMAQAQGPSRAEQLIKYRQALYTVLGGNFGPIAAMASGKAPFDPGQAALRAERVHFVARMLNEGFPAESVKGAPTRAKADIWANRAEFDRLLEELQQKTAELERTARTGDEAAIKRAVGATGQACKNCHDKFREEEKR